jgi:hypothetical protein
VRISISAIIILGLLTSSAYAQKQDPGPLPEAFPQKQVDERAYRDAVKRIPDQKSSPDPWGNVRDTGGANKKPLGSK